MEMVELQPDTTPVTLLDRAEGAPAYEKTFDGGAKIRKAAGKTEFALPRYIAVWLLQKDRDKVWTVIKQKDGALTPGPFEHRFALLEEDEEVVRLCGAAVLNADPILLDPNAVEQWDTTTSPLPRKRVEFTTLGPRELAEVRAYQRERQAGAAAFVPAG